VFFFVFFWVFFSVTSMERLFREPEEFDFVFEGTDINTCLLSAAVSFVAGKEGKKILHIDPNSVYGSQHATLFPSQITKNVTNEIPASIDRKFLLDVSPKLLLSADTSVDVLVGAGCAEFLTFSPVKILFRFTSAEEFTILPTSKAGVFADKKFTLVEKRTFMKFVNSVASSVAFNSPDKLKPYEIATEISEWDEYVQSFGLSERQVAMVNRCLCLCEPKTTTEGLKKIRTYMSSLGLFSDNALLYPNYGTSEILQALARRSAVHGGLFALNTGISDLCDSHIRLTTDDLVQAGHVTRSSPSDSSTNLVAIVRDSQHSGDCELLMQGDGTYVLSIGSHAQCCPEGFILLYCVGSEELLSEIMNGREIIFRAKFDQSEKKLLFDGEDIDRIAHAFAGLGLGEFPFLSKCFCFF
jgi:RAB protein geranylgeranyltransferase component A